MVMNTVLTGLGDGLKGETSDEFLSKKRKMIELRPEAMPRHLCPQASLENLNSSHSAFLLLCHLGLAVLNDCGDSKFSRQLDIGSGARERNLGLETQS